MIILTNIYTIYNMFILNSFVLTKTCSFVRFLAVGFLPFSGFINFPLVGQRKETKMYLLLILSHKVLITHKEYSFVVTCTFSAIYQ